jgi:hypothetical protein
MMEGVTFRPYVVKFDLPGVGDKSLFVQRLKMLLEVGLLGPPLAGLYPPHLADHHLHDRLRQSDVPIVITITELLHALGYWGREWTLGNQLYSAGLEEATGTLRERAQDLVFDRCFHLVLFRDTVKRDWRDWLGFDCRRYGRSFCIGTSLRLV